MAGASGGRGGLLLEKALLSLLAAPAGSGNIEGLAVVDDAIHGGCGGLEVEKDFVPLGVG